MSSRPILMMALSMLCLGANVAKGELSLGKLRSKFEAALESDGAEHAEKTLKMKEGYGGALDRLKGTLGREGKLEQAAQVLTEMERVEADGALVGLPDNADHRLKGLRTKWEREQEKLDEARRQKVAELANVYLKALEERKSGLTRTGKIREALVVEGEMKRVGEMEIVVKALAKEQNPDEPEEPFEKRLVGSKWEFFADGEKKLGQMHFVSDTQIVYSWRNTDEILWEKKGSRRLRIFDKRSGLEYLATFDQKVEALTFSLKGREVGIARHVQWKK